MLSMHHLVSSFSLVVLFGFPSPWAHMNIRVQIGCNRSRFFN